MVYIYIYVYIYMYIYICIHTGAVLLEQLAKQDRSSGVLKVCASTYKQ